MEHFSIVNQPTKSKKNSRPSSIYSGIPRPRNGYPALGIPSIDLLCSKYTEKCGNYHICISGGDICPKDCLKDCPNDCSKDCSSDCSSDSNGGGQHG